MRPYESMIIFDAELEEPAIAGVLDRRDRAGPVGRGRARIRRQVGKARLRLRDAAPSRGLLRRDGIHGGAHVAAEIDRLLHLADEVIRHKTVRLPESIKRTPVSKPAGRPAGKPDAPALSETN